MHEIFTFLQLYVLLLKSFLQIIPHISNSSQKGNISSPPEIISFLVSLRAVGFPKNLKEIRNRNFGKIVARLVSFKTSQKSFFFCKQINFDQDSVMILLLILDSVWSNV